MHATFVTLWLQVVQPLANVHETKWTPHVKRETDVAQSYTSSALMSLWATSMLTLGWETQQSIASATMGKAKGTPEETPSSTSPESHQLKTMNTFFKKRLHGRGYHPMVSTRTKLTTSSQISHTLSRMYLCQQLQHG